MSKEKERGEMKTAEDVPVEIFVGRELGTIGPILAKDESDSRQYTMLNDAEILALAYFEQVPVLEGGNYARDFCESFRRHKMSLSGWRANALVRLVGSSQGVPSTPIARRPGIIGRNVTQRDWKEKAEREGATILE